MTCRTFHLTGNIVLIEVLQLLTIIAKDKHHEKAIYFKPNNSIYNP